MGVVVAQVFLLLVALQVEVAEVLEEAVEAVVVAKAKEQALLLVTEETDAFSFTGNCLLL